MVRTTRRGRRVAAAPVLVLRRERERVLVLVLVPVARAAARLQAAERQALRPAADADLRRRDRVLERPRGTRSSNSALTGSC